MCRFYVEKRDSLGYILVRFLPENHVETWQNEEYEEPEPESDEDLVVDHVDGEDTETVESIIETTLLIIIFKLIRSQTSEYFLRLQSSERNILSLLERFVLLDLLVPATYIILGVEVKFQRTSSSKVAKWRTCSPYVENSPPRSVSIKYIWKPQFTRLRISQEKNFNP